MDILRVRVYNGILIVFESSPLIFRGHVYDVELALPPVIFFKINVKLLKKYNLKWHLGLTSHAYYYHTRTMMICPYYTK